MGEKTVLVVEDDEQVRARHHGPSQRRVLLVLEGCDPLEALAVAEVTPARSTCS